MVFRSQPVVFRFSGGFLDGRIVEADDPMWSYYAFLSDNGRVGARFRDNSEKRRKAAVKLLTAVLKHLKKRQDEGFAWHEVGWPKELAEAQKRCAFQNFEVRRKFEESERTVIDVHYVGDEIEDFGL